MAETSGSNGRLTGFCRHVLPGLLLLIPLLCMGFQDKDPWVRGEGFLALRQGSTDLWRFRFSTDLQKPCFHPVRSVNGPVLTWLGPPDHPWHHGLWFSWKEINGTNYWEEQNGKSQGRTAWEEVELDPRRDGSARITLTLTYGPDEKNVLLRETRTIEISAPADDGSWTMDWKMVFSAGEKDVTFDRHPKKGYAGLSVRLAKEMTETVIATSEGPEKVDEKSNRLWERAGAVDFSGRIGDKTGGVTFMDHPDNPRHPTTWYVFQKAPVFFGNAAILRAEPLVLPAGESMTLRYRLRFHDGRSAPEEIEQVFGNYKGDR